VANASESEGVTLWIQGAPDPLPSLASLIQDSPLRGENEEKMDSRLLTSGSGDNLAGNGLHHPNRYS